MSHFGLHDTDARAAAAAARRCSTRAAAAMSTFEGWVRNHNDGRARAAAGVRSVCAAGQFARESGSWRRRRQRSASSVRTVRIASAHWRIGEIAVWVGVGAAHRGEAFDACRYIIDDVKHRVPIWKKEYYEDGDSGWVNCEHCAAAARTDTVMQRAIIATLTETITAWSGRALHHVFVARQLLHAHRAACMKTIGRDADLRPMPNSPPSANCVEALCSTMALSTRARKRSAVAAFAVTIARCAKSRSERCARSPHRRRRPRARR